MYEFNEMIIRQGNCFMEDCFVCYMVFELLRLLRLDCRNVVVAKKES